MNLFDVHRGCNNLNPKPRAATADEMRAYLDWIAERDGVHVPPGVEYHLAGIWSRAECRYIVDMPGYGQAQVATCELLDDAGNVMRTMTLPQDKRGGIPATAKQVRDWCGLEPVKATRRNVAPVPVDPATSPAPAAAAVAPPTADVPKFTRGAIGRGNRALQMLTGEKPGMGRRALDNCFEEGDGGMVASYISWRLAADKDLATRAYYGRRSYRPAYRGDYPETHYASDHLIPEWFAIIVRHGVVPIAAINNSYGMRDNVAALLGLQPCEDAAPTADASQPVEALSGAPEPEIDAIGPSEAGMLDTAPIDLSEIAARVEALERTIAALSVKSEYAPTAREPRTAARLPRAQRTAAHERSIRRAWAERNGRRVANRTARQAEEAARTADKRAEDLRAGFVAKVQNLEAQLVAKHTNMEKWADEARNGRKGRNRRLAAAQRARRMIAASRAEADLKSRALDAANAAIAQLRRDMADPCMPERASDLARLVQERDQARTALAAVTARADRQTMALEQMADQFETMVSRVTKAEAAVRRLSIAA
ncbi:hypothetical protein [Novosphingobium sp.]|uniref:hypothetical protein n=1 Tax=Novosphingobium sp. TaxID=1874826 RepID=UPI002FDE5DFF